MDIKTYLNQITECRIEINRLNRKISQLEARATSTVSQVTGMPRGSGADRDALLAALADATSEYYAALRKAEQKELEINRFVDGLPTYTSRVILRLRYIERKPWSKVLAALNKQNWAMSERQMYRLHGLALKEARERYAENDGC